MCNFELFGVQSGCRSRFCALGKLFSSAAYTKTISSSWGSQGPHSPPVIVGEFRGLALTETNVLRPRICGERYVWGTCAATSPSSLLQIPVYTCMNLYKEVPTCCRSCTHHPLLTKGSFDNHGALVQPLLRYNKSWRLRQLPRQVTATTSSSSLSLP